MNSRTFGSIVFFSVFLALFPGCSRNPQPHPGLSEFTNQELRQGYRIVDKDIVFAFDPLFMQEALQRANLDPAALQTVRIAASFTLWKQWDNWNMKRLPGRAAWRLRRPLQEIMVPGNSGRPEFAFCAVKQGDTKVHWLKPEQDVPFTHKVSDQHTGQYNFVVVVPGDKREAIHRINTMINNPARKAFKDKGLLANFRALSGGRLRKDLLFRSYHPFTQIKSTPLEKQRTAAALALMRRKGIKAVVNLTDGEELKKEREIPEYYKSLLDSGRVLLARTKYNTVYFRSDSEEFARLFAQVARFIIKQEGPFLIHCQLGTDRTGVISAVLAGLGGATWDEIKADYERTNAARMGEYRSGALLRYSLEQLLGIRLTGDMKLESALLKWLKDKQILEQREIGALQQKLVG